MEGEESGDNGLVLTHRGLVGEEELHSGSGRRGGVGKTFEKLIITLQMRSVQAHCTLTS